LGLRLSRTSRQTLTLDLLLHHALLMLQHTLLCSKLGAKLILLPSRRSQLGLLRFHAADHSRELLLQAGYRSFKRSELWR
jgi:hypothetical protein